MDSDLERKDAGVTTDDVELTGVKSVLSNAQDAILHISDREADVGAIFLAQHPEHADYTPAEERKLLWKIDLILLPALMLAVSFAAADKILISNANLYGMSVDCNLVGSQYSWVSSIFFFGYLAFELPCNFILQKFPVGYVFAAFYLAWSVVLMCMAACNSFAGLAVCRFFFGALETVIFPSSVLLISFWYKKEVEAPVRMTCTFNGFSSLLAGPISYGVAQHTYSISVWRVIFLVFGATSVGISILIITFCPGSPLHARFLSEREKYIAIDRVKGNKTGLGNTVFKKDQAIEALLEWKSWVLFAFALTLNVSTGGLTTFAAQIVSGLGYSKLRTLLLGMPTGVVMTFSTLFIASFNYVLPRGGTFICAAALLVPIVCVVLIMNITGKISLLVCYYFVYFYWGAYPNMLNFVSANTAGSTKKTIVNTISFVSYAVANLIGPQLFKASEAPDYPTGYRGMLACIAVATTMCIIYGVGCWFENRQRDKKYGKVQPGVFDEKDVLDLTDRQKAETFRYKW